MTTLRRAAAPWAAALLAVIMSACVAMPAAPTVPSDTQARDLLQRATTLAQQGRFDELCSLGGTACSKFLSAVGVTAVPKSSPTILKSEPEFPQPVDQGQLTAAGRKLTVCGIDGNGRPYRTEMLVTWRDGQLHLVEPIYWSGMTINGPQQTPTSPPPMTGCT